MVNLQGLESRLSYKKKKLFHGSGKWGLNGRCVAPSLQMGDFPLNHDYGRKGYGLRKLEIKRSSYLQMIHHNFPKCFVFFFSGHIWQAKNMQKWGWRRNKRLLSTLSVSIKLKHIDVFVYFHEPSACTFWPLPPKKWPILQTFWLFRCKLLVMFINLFQTLEPAASNQQPSIINPQRPGSHFMPDVHLW